LCGSLALLDAVKKVLYLELVEPKKAVIAELKKARVVYLRFLRYCLNPATS